jgi:lysophospholipase L1-like esterase
MPGAPRRNANNVVANVIASAMVAVTLISAGILGANGELALGTPRSFYFVYLLVLLVLAVVVPWPWAKITLVLFAAFEATLGLGGHFTGLSSLMPANVNAEGRFRWHVLLQGTPAPSLDTAMAGGKRLRHTSEGTRGRERTADELQRKHVVALFGGSSTYDVGVGEGETWADRLEAELGPDQFAVINHGVPGYSTAEHLMQTAFYQKKFGIAPRCAVYYVGWNDIQNAHIADLDPGYADYHMRAMVDALQTRRVAGATQEVSPTLTVLLRLVAGEFDSVRYLPEVKGEIRSGSDPALEEIYTSNVRAISAINRDRRIRTVWIGQLLNRSRLTGEGRYGWFVFVRDRDVWPLQARFNEVLRDTARAAGDIYVDLPIEDFTAQDFTDQGHFSAGGAAKFARQVAPAIRAACN